MSNPDDNRGHSPHEPCAHVDVRWKKNEGKYHMLPKFRLNSHPISRHFGSTLSEARIGEIGCEFNLEGSGTGGLADFFWKTVKAKRSLGSCALKIGHIIYICVYIYIYAYIYIYTYIYIYIYIYDLYDLSCHVVILQFDLIRKIL